MTVEYFDVARPDVYEEKKELLESAGKHAAYYPLVFLDGELKIAGSAEYYEVLYALRQVLANPAAETAS